MNESLHPVASHHLPSFITAPGETDVLMAAGCRGALPRNLAAWNRRSEVQCENPQNLVSGSLCNQTER